MSRVYHDLRHRARCEDRGNHYRAQLAALKARGEDLGNYDVLVHADGQPGYIVPKTPGRTPQERVT